MVLASANERSSIRQMDFAWDCGPRAHSDRSIELEFIRGFPLNAYAQPNRLVALSRDSVTWGTGLRIATLHGYSSRIER